MVNKTARALILIVLTIAIGFTFYQFYFAKEKGVALGESAPAFSLTTLDGEAVSIEDLRGKGVLLNFWGWWCEPCELEMPYLNEAYQQMKDDGIVIVGVHIGGTPFEIKQFLTQVPVQFPILHDEHRAVTQLYEIGPIPTSFLIDSNGIVIDKLVTVYTSIDDVIRDLERIKP